MPAAWFSQVASLSQHLKLPDMVSVIDAAIHAADPKLAVLRWIKVEGDTLYCGDTPYDDFRRRRKIILGFGKASVLMAEGLLQALNGDVAGGVIISKSVFPPPGVLSPLVVLPGSHPVPENQNIASTQALLAWTDHLSPEDLVFCLVSGGGSALFTQPVEGVSLADIQQMTRVLLSCGATIQEINILRKHLDQVKGGGLARRVTPAALVTLILSDVVGNPLSAIASGPTVADPTTFQDALAVIKKYGISGILPANIVSHIALGAQGRISETVKPGDPCLSSVNNVVIASNEHAVSAAVEQAEKTGYCTSSLTTSLQGEAREAGEFLAGRFREEAGRRNAGQRPFCLVAGGETTVTLRGRGKGGRNQEVALAAVKELDGIQDVVLVTLATDGEDGPTDACGAVVTGETHRQAVTAGLDPSTYLDENNAYAFFDRLGDLIKIGSTGTNVNDLALLFGF